MTYDKMFAARSYDADNNLDKDTNAADRSVNDRIITHTHTHRQT